MVGLSVVIPIGPQEHEAGRLIGDLLLLPPDSEILFVLGGDPAHFPLRPGIERCLRSRSVRWLQAEVGRASQQNAGAAAARGQWLWFLHWDSGFDRRLLHCLQQQLAQRPEGLHYCQLRFMDDGAGMPALNSWGANLRSRWLGIPFGDQGLALSRALFEQLGGFDTRAPYGEDHLLVWAAHHQGVPLIGCEQPLLSSARKYRQHGWGRLTLCYQWLWLKQALPQWWRLWWRRVGS